MDSNNPTYVPTNPKSSTKRKPRRNPPQNTPQNPINYPQNEQNYIQQATNFPHNYPQEIHPNYHPNFQHNPMNYRPNLNYTGSQTNFSTQPMSQNFSSEPIYGSGFNVYDQSTPDGGESSNENDDINVLDEEDDEEEFEVPSTQQNFTQLLTQQSIQPTPDTQERQSEKKIWTSSETTALISAFMNTSADAITGTEQKKGVFWRRVVESYNAAREANPEEISFRTPSSLKGRWLRISEAVSKWCGSIDKAKARKRSGQNDNDVISEAHKIHQNSFGKFAFFDEWVLMKKWGKKWRSIMDQQAYKPPRGRPSKSPSMSESLGSGSTGKRSRDDGDGSSPNTPTSGALGDEFLPRPEGVKKAKSRLKGKEVANNSLESFGDRLQLYNEVAYERLEFEKKKEARKQKQIELEEKNFQMQQYKMNWEMLQQLLSKEVRAPWEEKMINELQEYIERSRGF